MKRGKMKLCSIFITLFTFIYSASGRSIISNSLNSFSGPESIDFRNYAMSVFKPLTTSKRLHMSMDLELSCENSKPGANLEIDFDMDGKEQYRMELPPQVTNALQAQCQVFRYVNQVEPVNVKIMANVVDRDSKITIIRNEIRISNGVRELVPTFSTCAIALFLLALLSKTY